MSAQLLSRLAAPLRALRQPTLMRRVMLALALAFGLAWAALVVFFLHTLTNPDQRASWLLTYGASTLASAEQASTPGEARAAAAATLNLLSSARKMSQQPGSVHLQLLDRQGQRVFPAPEDPAPAIAVNPGTGIIRIHGKPYRGSLEDVRIGGLPYQAYRADGAHWTVLLAMPQHELSGLFWRVNDDLMLNVLLVVPCFLLPIWLAVSRGLRPLKELSQHIAARGPDDLSPLKVDTKYGELKPLAGAIERLLLQLQHRLRRERAFVQDAAHELRTPMAVIAAQAHTLAKAPDGAQRQEAERRLEHAIERASHLVQQLLDLARIDSGRPGKAQALDIAQLVREELAQAAPDAMARGIELSLESPDALPQALEAHAFQSILQNLLSNALRYVQPGGQVAVELRRDDAGAMLLSVADNGPGIPEAERALVFERFYRAAGQEATGSGLGLAIATQAAQRLGGAIRLDTGPGGAGCTFTAIIPVATSTLA